MPESILHNEHGLVIPYEQLSPQALKGLIEEFVTRDGNDNGYTHGSLEKDVTMVLDALRRKEVVVVYDEATQTANIIPVRSHPTVLGHGGMHLIDPAESP